MLQNNQQLQVKKKSDGDDSTRTDAQILDLSKVLSLTEWRQFMAETIILLSLLMIVDLLWLGGTGYSEVQPTPLWIPVILISTQYGLMGGVIAAVLTSLVFYSFTVPAQWAGQDFYQYTKLLFGQPALWLLSALILGGLRSLQKQKMDDLELKLEKSQKQAKQFGHSLEDALKDNTHLEQLIAGEIVTVSAVLNSLSQIDMTDRDSVLNSFAGLYRDGLGAVDYTIYTVDDQVCTPLSRFKRGEKTALKGEQVIGKKLIERLASDKTSIDELDENYKDLLPASSRLVAPLFANEGGELAGVVLVREFHSNVNFSVIRHRSLLLGKALGLLLTAPHGFEAEASQKNEARCERSKG